MDSNNKSSDSSQGPSLVALPPQIRCTMGCHGQSVTDEPSLSSRPPHRMVTRSLFSYQVLPHLTPFLVTRLTHPILVPQRTFLVRLLGVRRKSRDSFNDEGVDDLLPPGREADSGSGRARLNQPICRHEATLGNLTRIRKHQC